MHAAGLTTRALSDVSFATAAAAFEAGYRDYVVPIALTAAGWQRTAISQLKMTCVHAGDGLVTS